MTATLTPHPACPEMMHVGQPPRVSVSCVLHLIARGQVYAKRHEPLHDNAEVAIMPPVQGG